jgi:uncharacterized protein with GYD domain
VTGVSLKAIRAARTASARSASRDGRCIIVCPRLSGGRGIVKASALEILAGSPRQAHPLPAVRKLIEGAGGKVISYYVTTGETDFLLISEANEAEAVIAALMAASGAGTISHVSTVRAWTAAEFKGIAEKAGKAASAYRPPGKH